MIPERRLNLKRYEAPKESWQKLGNPVDLFEVVSCLRHNLPQAFNLYNIHSSPIIWHCYCCTIFKMLYNFTTTYILLNLFPFMSESWAKNTVANIILPAYIICALFMEVGLNYTNIIGNEPILHEICVDFESQSDMKQTHKKRLEKKKRRKFMNRSKLFLQIQLIISTFLL